MGAPLNLTITGVTPMSVRLSWSPPERSLRNGEIVQYEIMYYKRSDPQTASHVNTTATDTVLDGLEPTTNYIFQIKAYTSKGPGPWSNQIPFQTMSRCKLVVRVRVGLE